MVTVNFTQFRQNAKIYFQAVEKGETVYVRRRGKVIAKIVPPTSRQPLWKSKALRLKIPGVSLSQSILKERQER
jgi:antitoxin (DNA-binding transcriptional repressor) of toxin-antitoxin stability system